MKRSIPERTIYSLVNYIHEKSYFGDSLISFQITVYKKCFVWKARLVDLAGHMSIVRRIRNWKLNRQNNFFSKSVINKVFLTTPAFELSLFGKILHIGYPHCTDNSSYSSQDRKLFFCRLIVHISEVCILLGFWFPIIYEKNTSFWTQSFLAKYCI